MPESMNIIRSLEELARLGCPVHLAIGVFDGVHLGHQRVIGQACDDARTAGGTAVALTFDPHPMAIVHPTKAPLLLTSTEHKLRLIASAGAETCLVLKFDKPFSETPPEQFIALIAAPENRLREICVGTRFRFGHRRAGDVRLMQALAANFGFAVREIQPVHTAAGEMISSTAVRQHVLHGHLDRAAAMLGRPFSILGTVVAGDRVGQKLGFPTANLDSQGELLPPDGVYAVRAGLSNESLAGVANIGTRPTFADREHKRILEVHLFDFDHEIYGQELEVSFLHKIRAEKKFESIDALKAQIAADVQAARNLARQ